LGPIVVDRALRFFIGKWEEAERGRKGEGEREESRCKHLCASSDSAVPARESFIVRASRSLAELTSSVSLACGTHFECLARLRNSLRVSRSRVCYSISLTCGTHFERSALFVLSGSDCCDSIELLSYRLYITGDRARAFFAVADALWDDALSICDIIRKLGLKPRPSRTALP
jgi:hypothetical protein